MQTLSKHFTILQQPDISVTKRVFLVSNSAWSILAETEEPTVLTQFFWNRNRLGTDLWKVLEPRENRNRDLEPRVTETHFLVTKMQFFVNFTREIRS